MKISKFIELYKNFGSDVAFSALGASRFRAMSSVKHKCILEYLKKNYSEVIVQYKEKDFYLKTNETQKENSAIWTLWWQGEENLPDIVKICHASVREHCGSHPFKVLTQKNLFKYVNLPEYIWEKFHAGAITITHLSDIIRLYLIFNYGGMWLDSTIFVNKDIPEKIFESGYYTIKRSPTPKNRNVAKDRWTNFLFAAQKENILCGFVLKFFTEYWKNQKILIDYFLADYAIALACEEISECKKLLDSVPVVNDDIYKLENSLNKEWSEKIFDDIKNSALFSKLAWRQNWLKKTFSGKETVFGHLMKNFPL